MLGERPHRVDLVGDLAGVREQMLAELGQGQAPCGAQHQALAQPVFEQGDPARDRRFGQADSLGSTAEAPGLGDVREDQEVVGFELFHKWDNVIRSGHYSRRLGTNISGVRLNPMPRETR